MGFNTEGHRRGRQMLDPSAWFLQPVIEFYLNLLAYQHVSSQMGELLGFAEL